MNRKDYASLMGMFFCEIENMVNSPFKYLDFTMTFKDRKNSDKAVTILSFLFDGETRKRVFTFPYDYPGMAVLNSRAVVSQPNQFHLLKKVEEISSVIGSVLPQEFIKEDIDFSIKIHNIEANDLSKYVLSVDRVKIKRKQKEETYESKK
ncbi:hypothetical protein C4565_08590 [Candidatus Parcubacteria bacterium]|jgi:hypothetical protein|nr:MAG: hypothetical protein C4565_08590 [Candidatus Parcubacteria bacterium]